VTSIHHSKVRQVRENAIESWTSYTRFLIPATVSRSPAAIWHQKPHVIKRQWSESGFGLQRFRTRLAMPMAFIRLCVHANCPPWNGEEWTH